MSHSRAARAHSNLYDNLLSGTIPDLSNLTSLTALDLCTNSLEGTIPDTLSSLTNLVLLCVRAGPALGCNTPDSQPAPRSQ